MESGKNFSQIGRRPVSLSVRGDLGYVIGVDLGSFLLRVVITDLNGSLCYRVEIPTRMGEGREAVLARAFGLMHQAIDKSQVSRQAVKGIGMAHSGVIDSANGTVLSFPRPGQTAQWRNVPLRDMLEAEFGIPAILDDSTRMMAIAEKCFGIGQQIKDFVYISVGMGIGAGIFIDDKLYRGSGGGAGEFGHMTVDEDGPLCSCGNSGCLEVLASCTAIIQSVRTAIQKGVSSKINEWVKGDLDRISIEIIARAAKENDALGFRVLYDAVFHIGVALADVINLLNPSTVVFGGPLFREAGGLLDTLRTVIRQRALEKFANELQLKISTLGSEAGALGAARMVSEKVLLRLYEEKTQMAHAS